jgi:hypothetical protein
VNRIIDIPAVHTMCVPKSPACRDLGTKVADRSTPRGICGTQHTNPLSIGGEWVWSMIGSGIRWRRRHLVKWQW